MADNTTLNAGTGGDVIASDDIGGVKFQRTKLALGIDGVFDGDVSATNPLPTQFRDDYTITGGSLSAPVINTDLLTGAVSGWYDARAWHSASIQIQTGAGISAGVVSFEQTNDTTVSAAGNTWFVQEATNVYAIPISVMTLGASATRLYYAPVIARYVRVRVSTAVVGGTVQATVVGSQLSLANTFLGQPAAPLTGPSQAASADSLANPTITQIGADGMMFNNATWDRVRNNINTSTGDTFTKTVTFNGLTQTNYNARGVHILHVIGTVSGSSPSMTIQMQFAPDGVTWVNLPGVVSAPITATGTYLMSVYPGITPSANTAFSMPLPRLWRLAYTITGTTPSFYFSGVPYALIL